LLLGKFARLAGTDAGGFGSMYSSYPLLRDKYFRTAQFLRMPLFNLKPALPTVGGGIHPASAVKIIKDLGFDLMLGVGGAIQGHPSGAAAGARAMRQAFDAVVEGQSLTEKAKTHSELQQAIELWGA
jgi:2,3-diketo-5-methylthiopentyl-1-phosphate enolase